MCAELDPRCRISPGALSADIQLCRARTFACLGRPSPRTTDSLNCNFKHGSVHVRVRITVKELLKIVFATHAPQRRDHPARSAYAAPTMNKECFSACRQSFDEPQDPPSLPRGKEHRPGIALAQFDDIVEARAQHEHP